ncbi:hypothetical protein EYF80_035832 [Liparis tanakae]|uniref:GIY-YIG domain-containing protein n=1 Tax=Liparis tanakae TaxID=230148 RepID=A0A4Z2GMA9_9TELE|nr:hypothetical protein EYF80_035832 [Liparis tanakae]
MQQSIEVVFGGVSCRSWPPPVSPGCKSRRWKTVNVAVDGVDTGRVGISDQWARVSQLTLRYPTTTEDVQTATRILFRVLRTRGYSRTFLRCIRTEVQNLEGLGRPPGGAQPGPSLVPFITTFTPASLSMGSVIRKHFQVLRQAIEPLQDHKSIIAFRRNTNLKDLLVHASLQSGRPATRNPHFRTTKSLSNPHANLGAPIRQVFHLDSANLVYAIRCAACKKIYIGRTKNTLHLRLKQHLYEIDRRPQALYTHFREHGREHLEISGLESRMGLSGFQRLRAEREWIQRLGTVTPSGLNEVL